MPEITLVAEAGRPTGSRASNRLRHAGRIPGVIYGHGIEPVPISVAGRELRAALTTEAGMNALLSVQVEGQAHVALPRLGRERSQGVGTGAVLLLRQGQRGCRHDR